MKYFSFRLFLILLAGYAALAITLTRILVANKGGVASVAAQNLSTLNVESVFSGFHENEKKTDSVTIVATGDVIPARSVNYQATSRHDFTWPYQKTADLTRSGDVTLINLESPLVKNCPVTQDGMIFCGDERNIEGLTYAGFDVANLANNHLGNYGQLGVDNTERLLSNAGIEYTGVDGPIFKKVRGVTFAFLGYSDLDPGPYLSRASEDKIETEIKLARSKSDVVVVSFHWGSEYTHVPGLRQRELAHLAVDSGADLIIGNHPHWVQAVEIYKNGFITYAHGNFVFDQMWSEKTEQGVVGKYTFYGKKLMDVEFEPIIIKDYGQPQLANPEVSGTILEDMLKASLHIRENVGRDN